MPWLGAAAAIAAIASLGLWMTRAQGLAGAASQPSGPFAELARFDPPKYVAPAFTGPEDDARRAFEAAMTHYVKGNYRGAIGGLRRAIDLDPASSHARLFLGVSLLLTGDAAGGVTELEGLLAVGPAPYVEESYFYLAKGLLRTGNVTKTRQALEMLLAFGGKYQAQAKKLLSRLDRLQSHSR